VEVFNVNDLQPLDIEDFSGGMADIDTPNDRKTCEIVENYDITNTSKLRTRQGDAVLDDTASLVSTAAGGVREMGQTGSLINYDDDLHLIIRSKQSLYAKNASTWDTTTAWTKLAGPNTGFEALPSTRTLTAHTVVSAVNWYNHQILAGKDESISRYISPQKVYLNESNAFKVLNAGLPKPCNPTGFVAYTSSMSAYIQLANALKSSLNTHMAATSGAHRTNQVGTVSTADASSLETLIDLTEALVFAYNEHANLDPNSLSGAGYNAHRINQMTTFGFDATKVTAALNFLVPYSLKPTTLTETAKVLDTLFWAYNLHLMAVMDPPDTLAAATWPTGAGSTVTWSTGGDTAAFTGVASYRTGDSIIFVGGTPPTGITLGTIYYAIKNSTTTIQLATSKANAYIGTKIDLTGIPAGTTTVVKCHTKLHPDDTGYISTIYNDAQLSSGFGVYPVDGNAAYYAWMNASFASQLTTFFSNLVTHMTSNKHGGVTTGGEDFMSDYADLEPTGGLADWSMWGACIRAYIAYRVHVAQNDTNVHTATTEAAGNVPSLSKMTYTQKYAFDQKTAATWEVAFNLVDQIEDMFVTHAATAARHSGGATTFTAAVGEYVWSQREYALVISHKYKTYNQLTFEEKSAPNYSESIAVCHTVDPAYGYSPYRYSVQIKAPMDWAFENYDDSNIALEVYRTLDGGTTFYLASQAQYKKNYPSPLTITGAMDETDDTTLVTQEPLYTTGGVVGRDPAPRCKSMSRLGDYVGFLGIVEEDLAQIDSLTFTNGVTSTTITLNSNGLQNGDAVCFSYYLAGLLTNLTRGKVYYVVNAATNSFGIATYPGGTPISVGNFSGSDVTGYMGRQVLKEFKNRLRQSFPGIGFSSPESFYVDFESDGIQVGSAQEKYVVVCKTGVYRVDGRFTEAGQGGMVREKISDRVGGVSALGGITVNDLFFFLGQDGFYMTDAYKVYPITKHLKTSVLSIVDQDRSTFSARNNLIQCVHNRQDNTIVWSFDPDSAGYATETWTLYLNHFNAGDFKAAFTKQKNGTQFRPTALGYFRGNLLRGDYQGFVFKRSSSKTNDPYINTASTGSLVASRASDIPFKIRSLPEDFGDRGTRKIVAKALLQFTNLGNFTCALKSINEKNTSNANSMKGIRFRQEYTGNIKEKRTFPVGSAGTKFQGTRCHLKQIQIESDTAAILYGSDDYALGTVVTNVMTLASGNWPTPDGSMIGMSIYTEVDDYATGYVITAVSTNTLTATSLPNMVGKKWIIKGAPRDEKHELLAYSMYVQKIESQPMAPTGDSGANA
jgi:hypothetical protein